MQSYYRVIPDYITRDKRLTDGEKIFFSFLSSLISKKGYCWATNKYLAKESGKSISQIQRYLRSLAEVKHIIIETECHTYRKIWTRESFNNKDILEETYGPDEFNQTFTTSVMDDLPVGHPCCTPAIYNVSTSKINKEKVVKVIEREAKAPPPPSFSQKRKSEERAPAITDEQKSELIAKIGEKEASKRIANAIKTLTNPRFANSPYRSMSVYDLALLYHENSKKERSETTEGRKEHNKEKAKSFLQANPHLDMLELTQNAVIFHHNGQGEEPTVFYKSTQFTAEMKEILDRWRLEYRWPPGDG